MQAGSLTPLESNPTFERFGQLVEQGLDKLIQDKYSGDRTFSSFDVACSVDPTLWDKFLGTNPDMSIGNTVKAGLMARIVPKEVASIETVHSDPSECKLKYAIEAGKKTYEEHHDEIVIAHKVTMETFLNLGFSGCPLLRLPVGDLLVRKVPDLVYRKVQSYANTILSQGLGKDGIEEEVELLSVAVPINFGGIGAAPDISLVPGFPTPGRVATNPAQIFVEVEHSHHFMRHARIMANLYFQNSDARGVAIIKIYNRNTDRTWAAVAAYFQRQANGAIVCQQACDFGTAPIHPSAMASFRGAPLAVQLPPAMIQPPSRRQIGGRIQPPFHFPSHDV